MDAEVANGKAAIDRTMSQDVLFPSNLRAQFHVATRRATGHRLQRQFAFANGDALSEEQALREITKRRFQGTTLGPDGRIVQFFSPLDTTTIPDRTRKQMRNGNPIIKAGLHARKAPIMHAFSVWRIESRDDRVRDFVRSALEPILPNLIKSALLSLDFGHAPHEKIFTRRDVHLIDGSTLPSAIVLKKAKELEPERVAYFVHADSSVDRNGEGFAEGDFAGFKHNNRDQEFVPANKSWIVTNEKEFGIITGRSILDAAYTPWYWWTVTTLFMNRYLERRGTPFIKGRAPSRVNTKDGDEKAGAEILADQLELLYDGGLISLPSERDQNGKELWDAEFMEDQGRGEQFLQWIEQCGIYMLLALLIPDTVLITPRREGSRALAEVRKQVFDEMSALTVQNVEQHINRFIIPQLIDLNRDQLGISPDAEIPQANIRAQVRPTDRQELLMRLLEALIRAKDAPAAEKIMFMASIQEILSELGAPLSRETLMGEEPPEPVVEPEPEPSPSQSQGQEA